MDEKPLSSWSFPISINAIIATLTTACTSAIMHNVSAFISQLKWLHFKICPRQLYNLDRFDEASRGPYGSVIFIFRVRWNLATVGALITIFRLAFGPLVQQVVNLQPRDIVAFDSNATFGYAHAYARNFSGKLPNSVINSVPQDPLMQSAVLQGLFNISSPPLFICTGSCVWEDSYISLGFKSTCEDVTTLTLQKEHCSGLPSDSHRQCNMTTPGGLTLSTRLDATELGTIFDFSSSSSLSNYSYGLPPDFPTISKFAVYRSTWNPYVDAQYDVNITECALSLAAYEYSNTKANGSSFEFGSVKEVHISHNGWMGGDHGDLEKDIVWTNESMTEGVPQLKVSWSALKSLQIFFESSTLATEWVDGYWDNMNPGISAALMGDVDLPKRFEKMAMSMTDYVRSSGPNSQVARGYRIASETFVFIRWSWVVGPIAIELAAILFAVLTIVSNAKHHKAPLWKSSVLALLDCTFDKATGLIRTKVKDIKDLKKGAKEYKAQLK
ncbi:hypothetical protein BGZ63DRAFT_454547 [Mariannaea sp. PMI_226]|nr:hypothetical protein BGZ63DRAFT_454547 [Mariannaea sp. PMI_226]